MQACSNQNAPQALNAGQQQQVNAFDQAQSRADTSLAQEIMLTAYNADSQVFCTLASKAQWPSILHFLEGIQFLEFQEKNFLFHFENMCNAHAENIWCLVQKVNSYELGDKVLVDALKIAGLNNCDAQMRNTFARKIIETNTDLAAKEMMFISNFLKMRPNDKYFIQAMHTMVENADKKLVLLFLQKISYISFNSKTDEYTNIDTTKINHLQQEIIDKLLNKAQLH